MPKGKPYKYAGGGFIQSLREKHEPHMRLAAQVDFNHNLIHGIETKLRDLPKIHKTLSKSFGMQRKTLLRVIELEKQVDAITIIVENIQDGLEDAIDKKKRRRRRRRGRPSAKRPPETPKDWDEEVPGDWDATHGTTPEGEEEPDDVDDVILDGEPEDAVIGQPDPAIDPESDLRPIDDDEEEPEPTVIGEPEPEPEDDGKFPGAEPEPEDDEKFPGAEPEPEDPAIGDLDPDDDTQSGLGISEELKSIHSSISKLATHTRSVLEKVLSLEKRVSINEKKITSIKEILKSERSDIGDNLSDLEPDTDEDKVKSPLSESIQNIADSTTSIHETLIKQQDLDKAREDDTDIDDEQDKRDKKEQKGEGIGAGIQKVGMKMLAPVQNAMEKVMDWIRKLIMAKAVMMFMNWFSDPANKKKVQSLFRFIKDWWPAIVTGLLLFAGSMLGPTGIIIGITALIVGFIPKVVNAIKSFFGFGKDTEKEAEKGQKQADKALKGESKEDKKDVSEDLTVGEGGKIDTGKFLNMPTPRENEGVEKFNKGGQVPGQGDKDTVPAMLTPGEFVMSKGAVEQYGVDTLEGMNAAAGGTNEPKEIRPGFKGGSLTGYGGGGTIQPHKLFGYQGGGQVQPSMGYGPGQVMPDQFVYNQTEFKEKTTTTTRDGELIDHKSEKSMTDIGGAIAVDDLKKHQMQLVESLRKVKGYENVNFIDVMQYPDGKGRLVGMPVKELYKILNESDAAKATSAKKEEANRKFLMDNNLIKPDGSVKGFSYYDGKLTVDGETRDAVLATGAVSFETGKLLPNKLEISSNQSGTSTPGAPTPPTTTVAYQQAQSSAKGSSGTTSGASPGGSVPDFSASAKVDGRKVKVLGISR